MTIPAPLPVRHCPRDEPAAATPTDWALNGGTQGHQPPEAKTFAQRRRDRRRPVLYRAELVVLGEPAIRCTVLDLTDCGAKVQVNKPVSEGHLVKLMSLRFTRKARVAWTAGDLVGLEFMESRLDVAKSLDAPA